MKWYEWTIAIVLIGLGVLCLALSGMPRLHADFMGFMRIIFQLCFWMCIPVIMIGGVYLLVLFIRQKRKGK